MAYDKIPWLQGELAEVGQYIERIIESMGAHASMKELLGTVMENPGKMIRSVVLLLTAGDYDNECREELLTCAAAIEMIHSSSLILDDMIDESPLRRGRPTVYRQHGTAISLCSGNYMLVASIIYLTDMGYPDAARELMEVIIEACDGEMIQNENIGNTSVSREAYETAIRGKTACFFRAICGMASRITGKSETYPVTESSGF